jgi:hypothetical protein
MGKVKVFIVRDLLMTGKPAAYGPSTGTADTAAGR